MKTFRADSIQAIVTTVITGQENDHVEAIPCSPETIQSLLLSPPEEALIVCKAITWSSRESFDMSGN